MCADEEDKDALKSSVVLLCWENKLHLTEERQFDLIERRIEEEKQMEW